MKVIDAYRSKHTIAAVKDWDDDLSDFTMRCRTDLIRVHPTKDGGWYHDPTEIRRVSLLGTVMPLGSYDPIEDARGLVLRLDERRRLLDADVEEANRWTEDELVTIANQSGMDVRRA